MKKKLVRGLLVITAVAMTAVLLGAAQGSQTDPLVTMSYLNDVAAPAILKDLETKMAEREKSFAEELSQLAASYEAELGGSSSGDGGESFSSAAFVVVTLQNGQTLTGGTGLELLLRAGTATCVAPSAPGLVDFTEGSTLDQGGAVQPNHLYLATDEGRGVKATADVTLLVRGTYSIA